MGAFPVTSSASIAFNAVGDTWSGCTVIKMVVSMDCDIELDAGVHDAGNK